MEDQPKATRRRTLKSPIKAKASDIDALPPWHPDRKTLRLGEVPQLLKRIYGITVGAETVRRWAREGVSTKTGARIFLKVTMMGKWRMVHKRDLQAFLKEW